ncbi:MAG: DHCW motif cupin fold protein [Chitinophagaceae bacterium]|nr:DHCW motif cupin fold protein [Chitinophagaceae bacterium]
MLKKKVFPGTTGTTTAHSLKWDIRVRMVEYSANYLADHWCKKGHIIYCIEGENDNRTGRRAGIVLSKGMTYHVGDNCEAHRAGRKTAAVLSIVD